MDNPRLLGGANRIETPNKKGEGVPLPPHILTVPDLPACVQNGPTPPMAEEVVRHLILSLPPPHMRMREGGALCQRQR